MKKLLIAAVLFLIAGYAFSQAPTANRIPTLRSKVPVSAAWPEGKNLLNVGITSNGYWALQYGTTTNNGVVTFAKSFSATPAITVSWDGVLSGAAGKITNAIVVYPGTATFTASCSTVVATNMNWMAVGPCSP